MASLPPSRKAYLLSQSRASRLKSTPSNQSPAPPSSRPLSFISLSTGTSAGIARLLPQMTGSSTGSASPSVASRQSAADGWSKRLSIASFGSWTGFTAAPASKAGDEEVITPRAESGVLQRGLGEAPPLERQTTGGLWGWWTGTNYKPEEGSAEAFIEGLRDT
jgi:hypothetical protein